MIIYERALLNTAFD